MMDTVKHAAARAALVKVMLDSMRLTVRAHVGHDRVGERATDLIVCMAVIIGHAEGRPMTASDIASYIGLPRTTVTRRLRILEADGVVASQKVSNRVVVWINRVNDDDVVETFYRAATKALDAAPLLSKAVSQAVDSG